MFEVAHRVNLACPLVRGLQVGICVHHRRKSSESHHDQGVEDDEAVDGAECLPSSPHREIVHFQI